MTDAERNYLERPLRAHSLLDDVEVHDVWSLDVPAGGAKRTMLDLRALVASANLADANAAVKFLFGIRAALGKVFGWDDEPTPRAPGETLSEESYAHRLTDDERNASLVPTGSSDGPFKVLYVTEEESISEIINPTVHAFSVFALEARGADYRIHWAVYVKPVGAITNFYMALIDPFRRFIIYPAVLRHVERTWREAYGEA